MKKATQWILVLSGIAGLSLFGVACNSGDDHGDHDHDHGDHEEHAEGGEGGGEQAAAGAKDDYPLEVCIVSGEGLHSMGEPVSIQHEGMTVKFCCESCIEDFNEDPGKYLPKLTAAMGK